MITALFLFLARWWHRRGLRARRTDRIDWRDARGLLTRVWPRFADPNLPRLLGVVMIGVREGGKVDASIIGMHPSLEQPIWRASGLAALRHSEPEHVADKPREVN